jgi:hypothetical protein
MTTTISRITDNQIREALGHNGAECRVRIRRDGTVERHGSPTPTDRSKDFWAYLGTRDEIARDLNV